MRHKHGYRKLSRDSAHRAALLKNLSISLIEHQSINTTLQKAKELRSYIEKLVTVAKRGDFNAHRALFSKLQHKSSTKKLIETIAPKYTNTRGGYTRIKKRLFRRGDAASLATIEFV